MQAHLSSAIHFLNGLENHEAEKKLSKLKVIVLEREHLTNLNFEFISVLKLFILDQKFAVKICVDGHPLRRLIYQGLKM